MLELFDASSGTFLSTYSPPAAIATPTATTLPGAGPTGSSSPGATGEPGSAEIPSPTGTGGGGQPGSGGDGNSDPGGSDGSGGSPSPAGATKSHAAAIALGTTFGVLALLVGAVSASYYVRRRHARESFHLLGESNDGDSPHGDGPIPVAGMAGYRESGLPLMPVVRTVRDRLSRVVPGISLPQDQQERRDMLADEDTREFETNGWYTVRRDPSGSEASWSSRRRPAMGRVYDSLASLRSVGGAMLDAAGAAVGRKSREPSTTSRASTLDDTIWDEKRESYNPYTDEYGVDKYTAPALNASRPRGGRQGSSITYVDPFEDYDVESLKYDSDVVYRDDDDEDDARGYPPLRDPPPRPKIQTLRLPGTTDLTRLTPVSEDPSVPTLTDRTSSNASLTAPTSGSVLMNSGGNSSSSSHEPPVSPRRPSSILDSNPPPGNLVKRSDSWWTRFARTPLLERATIRHTHQQRPFEFRDPNPPPRRLVPIEEAGHSTTSPDSPESKRRTGSGGHTQRFSTHHHGRSASSLQTARTADTEQLERMASTMQIVQKEASDSQRSFPSRETSGSSTGLPATEFGEPLPTILGSAPELPGRELVLSPVAMSRGEAATVALPDPALLERPPPPGRRSPGRVSQQVQAYERRMSQSLEASPPKRSPPPVPARLRNTSTYGLAPRQSLFVANPDHKKSGSGDS